MYISGTMDARWNNDVLNPAFGALTADDFEVIQLGWAGCVDHSPRNVRVVSRNRWTRALGPGCRSSRRGSRLEPQRARTRELLGTSGQSRRSLRALQAARSQSAAFCSGTRLALGYGERLAEP